MKKLLFIIVATTCVSTWGCSATRVADRMAEGLAKDSIAEKDAELGEKTQEELETDSEPGDVKMEETPEEETHKEDANDDSVITVDNNDDFREVMSYRGGLTELYQNFSDKYKNRVIEFDGFIYYIDKHGNTKTRIDLLVNSGDYVDEETVNPGPIFKFEDVGFHDPNLDVPYPSMGTNIHVIAEIEGYNKDRDLFYLHMKKISAR